MPTEICETTWVAASKRTTIDSTSFFSSHKSMIDHHGIRITFYSTGRTTRYSQQVADPQDTNRIARESVDLTRLTARVFRAVVAWAKSSVRLIVRGPRFIIYPQIHCP